MIYILFENIYCTNLRGLKAYQASFPTTMEWNWKWVAEEKLENSQHLGNKQHTLELPIGHRRNQKGNQKIVWEKWKQNTTYQSLWDAPKAILREKFIVVNTYNKKKKDPN